jgi:hypothetical protein
VGSEMCIRDSPKTPLIINKFNLKVANIMTENLGVMYYQSRMPYGDPLKPSKRKQFPVRNLHYQFHDSVFPESDARVV